MVVFGLCLWWWFVCFCGLGFFFVCWFGVWLLFLFPHGLKHLSVFLGDVSSGSEIYNEEALPSVKHE